MTGNSAQLLVVEAVDALLESSDAAHRLTSQHLPLQQLFALCHLGAVTRAPTDNAAGAATEGLPILGVTLVRLLDACLSAAASLPDEHRRQRSVDSVVAAFCRAALREAHCRSAAVAAVPTAPAAASSAEGTERSASCIGMDRVFLDASFTLLAALLERHRASLGGQPLRLLHTAWGAPGTVPPGSGPQLHPVAADVGSFESMSAETSAVVAHEQDEQRTGAVSQYFVGAGFNCKVAAGQLLFGRSRQRNDGASGGVNGRVSTQQQQQQQQQQQRRVLLQTMAKTPAALELCAAAAVADTLPGLAAAEEAGLDWLACWLQCGVQAGAGGFDTLLGPQQWEDDDGDGPSALLEHALLQHPAEVLSAVPAAPLAVVVARAPRLRQALPQAVAALLQHQQPAAPGEGDGWLSGNEEADTDGWGTSNGPTAGAVSAPVDSPTRRRLQQLHTALQAVGLDMGALLQQSMAAAAAASGCVWEGEGRGL
ncbi:hypothetical protein HYH02_007146 [Chlamydomonas schloesseri]|uniref:Uncharacterized protein n=1 Tax=Chlamydomonas schloesseri TaxID=2026947 RepID=A0A835WHT6_9CHLO|nr:hypothetical protein HYH02_007146 [Chlamydomonas schloesseri]|eukprot:KAG2447686.1 hypothetical protein HYH02_007146 [Chlamydomonas schloesseri]